MKHKIIQDFHYLSDDKKITILKAGTIIQDYIYKAKGIEITIDEEVVNVNKEFFTELDWKTELVTYLKVNKIAQPAILSKKLFPFIEDMIISSEPTGEVLTDDKVKEVEQREFNLNRREKNLIDQEEDLEIRIKRIEKREGEYKEDILLLDKKEEILKIKVKETSDTQLQLDDLIQDINEKERNMDAQILEAASNLDQRYTELQSKIESDIKSVTEKELFLENKAKELNKLENGLTGQLDEINDKREKFEQTLEEFTSWEAELHKLNGEIQDWENLHWKFQRNCTPPSVIV